MVDAEDVVAHILRDLVEQVPERGDRVWHVGKPNSQSMEEHASPRNISQAQCLETLAIPR